MLTNCKDVDYFGRNSEAIIKNEKNVKLNFTLKLVLMN